MATNEDIFINEKELEEQVMGSLYRASEELIGLLIEGSDKFKLSAPETLFFAEKVLAPTEKNLTCFINPLKKAVSQEPPADEKRIALLELLSEKICSLQLHRAECFDSLAKLGVPPDDIFNIIEASNGWIMHSSACKKQLPQMISVLRAAKLSSE